VLDGQGQPKPIAIRLGPSDGAFTQILPVAGIAEGVEVVIGGGPRNAEPTPAGRGPAPRGPRLF
jgi:HlyD family secretion protein